MSNDLRADELIRFTLTARSRCVLRSQVASKLRHLADMAELTTRIDGGFDGDLEWDMWCDPAPNEENR